MSEINPRSSAQNIDSKRGGKKMKEDSEGERPHRSSSSIFSNWSFQESAEVVGEAIRAFCTNLYSKTTAMDPLPKNFDYTFATYSYYWRTVGLIAYTSGFRLGSTSLFEAILSIFPSFILFVLTYIAMPAFAIVLHQKTPMTKLNLNDRRILLILHCFIIGIFAAHLLRFYHSDSSEPPVYFLPALVGLSVWFLGPEMSHSRPLFLMGTVGASTIFAFIIGSTFHGPMTFKTLINIIIQALSGMFYVQSMIFDVTNGDVDIVKGNLIGFTISCSLQLATKIFFCTYDPTYPEDKMPSYVDIVL